MTAQVAVEAAVYQIDRPFTYLVPDGMSLSPGMRVSVPFGRGNRTSEGIVLTLGDESGLSAQERSRLKSVIKTLDVEPLLDERGLRLAAFLRERYFCTFYDAVRAMLPAGLWVRASEVLSLTGTEWRERLQEGSSAYRLMEELERLGGSALADDLARLLDRDLSEDLRRLKSKGLVAWKRELFTKSSDKTESLVTLILPAEEALHEAAAKKRKAPVQAAVLELLASAGSMSSKELCYFTGAGSDTLKRLETAGFLVRTRREVFRSTYTISEQTAEPICLTEEQESVYQGILPEIEGENTGVSLLYGITGSGKTAVYITLIHACLERGKSAMLLVPEIGLTPQLVSMLTAHFGERIAVLHSALSAGARYDEWKRIRRGDASVVVGTRSAVFAPLVNPGLFIVDEEHDHSYKSENTPRYHAREVAILRGSREGAPVLLGSATPSVESMYRALGGVYRLYRLRSRYNGRELPGVEIVDMKEELRHGNASTLSFPLQQALKNNEGHQAILFLNRRGSSRMMVCVDCGDVPECPNCSVHLTYHQANGRLMCHYCGYSEPLNMHCPVCGGHRKAVGFGTQRVQTELMDLFPGREILRMDADTVSAVNSHDRILTRFREGDAPVLVGTQMITKGLNFPKVNLVGVLDADASLYMENYRAAETAFSIITQVVGRAGRGETDGRAFIQTMTPENPVIRLAASQDYDGFYALELPLRQLRGCPPFADLAVVHFVGASSDCVEERAVAFRDSLLSEIRREGIAMGVYGPASAPVAKVCGRYRFRLTLSIHNTRQVRQLLERMLRGFLGAKESKGVGAYIDINPYE